MIDPLTVISTIAAGLKLIEQFREMMHRRQGTTPTEPSVTVKTVEDRSAPSTDAGKSAALEVQRNGQTVAHVGPKQVQMGKWDQERYETLKKIVDMRMAKLNALDVEAAMQSGVNLANLRLQMEQEKAELCPKFREMLAIYEKALGIPLGDHFSLESICGGK